MPFGMKNSGATLVWGLRMLISELENVDSYIDDLIVYTEDWDTHIRVLDELMNRLQQANLTARPTKCVFGAKSVEFLGHQVGFEWITVNDDNLEKIRMAQRPTTKKEVRSFLGLVNYYRAHIPLFAAISAPLSDLTRKGQPNKVQWDKTQERAFLTLQERLLKRPILKLQIIKNRLSCGQTLQIVDSEHRLCKSTMINCTLWLMPAKNCLQPSASTQL